MGMLNGKDLSEVRIKDFILFLDTQNVGYNTTINSPPTRSFNSRPSLVKATRYSQ
jgi:hypothetical protein